MRTLLIAITSLLIASSANGSIKVKVQNKTNIDRVAETIEIPLNEIKASMAGVTAQNIVVRTKSGAELPTQFTKEALLFQVTLSPKSSKIYTIDIDNKSQKSFTAQTFGRLVPERMDDWAWENNRIAFRMYGPALEATGEISNGIDVWLKRTPELIVNKWYKPGVNYHADKGEGLDNYKVGRTLGAGGMAPLVGTELALGKNFIKAELVDSGAIRTTVRLTYAPFKVGDKMVSEERIISLDASSQMNRVTEIYSGHFELMPVVAAIVLRKGGQVEFLEQGAIYTEPEDKENGTTHLAVVMPQKTKGVTVQNHAAATAVAYNGKPLTYLCGAGWSKFGFPTAKEWKEYVEKEIIKLNNPLTIKLLK